VTLTYEGRRFAAVRNTSGGDVSHDTTFEYHQRGHIVWATYSGGAIEFGTLIATVLPGDELDMRYQHVNRAGQMMTGTCRSVPETLPDGRLRLHETWQWTCGDGARGRSIVEEIPAPGIADG